MYKKAQAAMEFLMTYGWAILVVLAAIGALAYFGVLSPDRFLPEKCMLDPGIDCTGFKVTPTETTLVLRNGMGKDMTVTGVTIGDCNLTTAGIEFKNTELVTFSLTGCNNGALGDRFDNDISIAYTETLSGLSKTMVGNMVTKVQS